MNYNKVIKDLKERNDKLQEQYRLRDIRCIHLEYENEMLKSDFEAQHELTKKYAEENQKLKIQISAKEEVANKYKEVIDKAIKCIDYNTKYRNGADIYQFVDIESEILEPLKYILESDEKNGDAYLKEFNDWLKEVE